MAGALARKLKNLGMDCEEELQALLLLVKAKGRVKRGEDTTKACCSHGYSTILLKGLACIPPEQDHAVAALTDCSIGVLLHEDIERATALYPGLGLALWRSTMVEASIFQERLLNVSLRPALPRMAHLLCELMVRLDAIGIDGSFIPMTQVDLADAASLSLVHMNRTI